MKILLLQKLMMIYIAIDDYVLDETFTLLFRRTPSDLAAETMTTIDDAIDKGYLVLERITPDRFEKTKKLRLKSNFYLYISNAIS